MDGHDRTKQARQNQQATHPRAASSFLISLRSFPVTRNVSTDAQHATISLTLLDLSFRRVVVHLSCTRF
jgi:hypothetical protein